MACYLELLADPIDSLPEHHLPIDVDCCRGLVTIMLHDSSLSAQLLPPRVSQTDLIK